jgi:hypothetical protein
MEVKTDSIVSPPRLSASHPRLADDPEGIITGKLIAFLRRAKGETLHAPEGRKSYGIHAVL